MEKERIFKDEKIIEIIMKTIHIKTCMNAIVAVISIASIIFTTYYPDWLIPILGIEIIVLPIIYIIGNNYIEEQIKQEYEENINNLSRFTEQQDMIINEQEKEIYKLNLKRTRK